MTCSWQPYLEYAVTSRKPHALSYYGVAENIAFGQANAAAVFAAWLGSSGHKENIVHAEYRDIGLGVATASNGQLYWCVDFGVIVP